MANSPTYTCLLLVTEQNQGTVKFLSPTDLSIVKKQYIFSSEIKKKAQGSFLMADVTIVNDAIPKIMNILREFHPAQNVFVTVTFVDNKAAGRLFSWLEAHYTLSVDQKEFIALTKGNKSIILLEEPIEAASSVYCDIRSQFSDKELILTIEDDAFIQNAKPIIASLEKKVENNNNPYRLNGSINGYVVPDDLREFFEIIAPQVIERGLFYMIQLYGKSGNGKTATAKALTNHLNNVLKGKPVEYLKVSVPNLVDPTQWFGIPKAKDGNTFFDLSPFSQVISNGRCVVLLDETNRVARGIAGSLLGLFDDTGTVTIEDHEIIRGDIRLGKGHGVIVVLTMNMGEQYAIEPIDAAFANRCAATFEVQELDEKTLKATLREKYNVRKSGARDGNPFISIDDINTVYLIISDFKKIGNEYIDLSMRTYMKVLDNMNLGVSLIQAVKMAVVNTITDINTRKGFADVLVKYMNKN